MPAWVWAHVHEHVCETQRLHPLSSSVALYLIHRGRVSHLIAYTTDSSCLPSQLALKPLSVPHEESARGRGGRPYVPGLTGVLGIQIQIPALA